MFSQRLQKLQSNFDCEVHEFWYVIFWLNQGPRLTPSFVVNKGWRMRMLRMIRKVHAFGVPPEAALLIVNAWAFPWLHKQLWLRQLMVWQACWQGQHPQQRPWPWPWMDQPHLGVDTALKLCLELQMQPMAIRPQQLVRRKPKRKQRPKHVELVPRLRKPRRRNVMLPAPCPYMCSCVFLFQANILWKLTMKKYE